MIYVQPPQMPNSTASTLFMQVPKKDIKLTALDGSTQVRLKNAIQYAVEEWRENLADQIRTYEIERSINSDDIEQLNKKIEQLLVNLKHSYSSALNLALALSWQFPKIESFMPDVTVDGDGDVGFEWLGRQGARCAIVTGANGELYWSEIFHSTKSYGKDFLLSGQIPERIIQTINKVYKDSL